MVGMMLDQNYKPKHAFLVKFGVSFLGLMLDPLTTVNTLVTLYHSDDVGRQDLRNVVVGSVSYICTVKINIKQQRTNSTANGRRKWRKQQND